jgi:hypothetical protein
MKPLRIKIVGGSLAGLFAGVSGAAPSDQGWEQACDIAAKGTGMRDGV